MKPKMKENVNGAGGRSKRMGKTRGTLGAGSGKGGGMGMGKVGRQPSADVRVEGTIEDQENDRASIEGMVLCSW